MDRKHGWASVDQKVHALSAEVGEIKDLLQALLGIAEVSLDGCLSNARKAAEVVVGQVIQREGLPFDFELLKNIETLGGTSADAKQRRGGRPPVLPSPVYSAFHGLRIYGNQVIHPFDAKTMERKDLSIRAADLDVALAQLLRIVEWYFTEYSRPPVEPLYESLQAAPVARYGDPPPRVDGFLGRTRELAWLEEQLSDPQVRCVYIHAPGGTGKTLLAARAAQLLAGSRLGGQQVVWFDLASSPPFHEIAARWVASCYGEYRLERRFV